MIRACSKFGMFLFIFKNALLLEKCNDKKTSHGRNKLKKKTPRGRMTNSMFPPNLTYLFLAKHTKSCLNSEVMQSHILNVEPTLCK